MECSNCGKNITALNKFYREHRAGIELSKNKAKRVYFCSDKCFKKYSQNNTKEAEQ